MSYKLSNPSHNKNLTYFEGQNIKKLSTLSSASGKFNAAKKLDNVFIEINRPNIATPSPFNYSIPSNFKSQKNKSKFAETMF